MIRPLPIRLLPALLGTLALAVFSVPALALAAEAAAPEGATVPSTTGAASPPANPSPSPSTTAPAPSTPTSTAPGEGTEEPTTAAPQVQAETPQVSSNGPAHRAKKAHATHGGGGTPAGGSTSTHVHAPSPSALTPPLPSALGSSLAGVPDFFIANFPMPPFLLPIYQAAGKAYGVPWQVLAAINEVETDYGRNLSLSTAGAEGWMQFLPSSWAQYGVDANGDGFADPYNPADAIFAAARYLRAAGGAKQIRPAIFAYNHSQSYVASVLLRSQLLHGTPPQLLGAIADLAEARFPVHAPAHFSDGFPQVPGHPGRTLVATAIDSAPGAPVIAVQDGVIAAIGRSESLGRYVKLRDVYGDTYTYGRLGGVAELYPVLAPHTSASTVGRHSARGAGADGAARGIARRAAASSSSASASALPPASAGVQLRSPLTAGAVSSGLALGAAARLEAVPPPHAPSVLAPPLAKPHRPSVETAPRVFRAGHEDVYLHPLRVGAQVIAGTVIGHMGEATGEAVADAAGDPQARMIFQIRPSGVGAPAIDPKPILDGWVRLEGSLIYRATGKHRFPAAVPETGGVAKPGGGSALNGPAVPGGAVVPLASKRSHGGLAVTAGALNSALTPGQWLALMARLGAIPDPAVAAGHSAASIPDRSSATSKGSRVYN